LRFLPAVAVLLLGCGSPAAVAAPVANPPMPPPTSTPKPDGPAKGDPCTCGVPRSFTEAHADLPAPFTAFRDDGAAVQAFAEQPGTIAVVDASTGAVIATRPFRAHALEAASFDGSMQVVPRAQGFALVNVDTNDTKPLDPALVPAQPTDTSFVLSQDGHLLAVEANLQATIYDTSSMSKLQTLDLPFAGGSDPSYSFTHGGRFVLATNSRGLARADLRSTAATTDWLRFDTPFDDTPDGAAILAFAGMPFARDYQDHFHLLDGRTGAERGDLPLVVARGTTAVGAICPTGALAVVVAEGTLHFFETRTKAMKEVLTAPVPPFMMDGGGPLHVRFAASGNALVLARNRRIDWLHLDQSCPP
jgi:hypothetical protein